MNVRRIGCATLRTARTVPVLVANRRARSRVTYDRLAPVLLLSPHLDDAVLNCWSVLEKARNACVINVFAQVPPQGLLTFWDRICGADDSAIQMGKRIAEDLEALAMLGIVPTNLPFLDQMYRHCSPPPSLIDLDAEVSRVVSSASAVFAPVGIEHADHRLVREYAALIGGNGVPTCLYADVPYATRFGWPAWVTGGVPDPHLDVDVHWSANGSIPDRPEARIAVLDGESSVAKLNALRVYRSQLPALDGGPHHAVSNPAVHGFEVFWERETASQ